MSNKIKQMSDSLLTGIILALVGGFLDAYTYITRGGVFANAQTGNIVLMGVHFSEGNIKKTIVYGIPVLSFFLGIIIAEIIKSKYQDRKNIHWRQIIIALECIIVCIVAFIPESANMAANVLISFICSLQVESFRKVNGNAYSTTMCTGNLRSATECLYKYSKSKDKESLKSSLQYFCIIAVFIVGACVGTIASKAFGLKAPLIAAVLLLIVGILLSVKFEKDTEVKSKTRS